MTPLLIDRATLAQLVEDVLEINRAIGKGGVAYDINIRAYPAIERALKALRAALANAEPDNSYDLAKRADNEGQP